MADETNRQSEGGEAQAASLPEPTEVEAELAQLRQDLDAVLRWIRQYANPALLRTLNFSELRSVGIAEGADSVNRSPDISARRI
jgi:hypothetical protein